jgi:hypothetical protein
MDNNSSEANSVWQTRKNEERVTLVEVVRQCEIGVRIWRTKAVE